MVIEIGDGFFTDDAEYVVEHSRGEFVVVRGDGSYAKFPDLEQAREAAESLALGEREDDDYVWDGPHGAARGEQVNF